MNKTLIAALSLSILLVAPACHRQQPKKATTKSTAKSIDLIEAMIEQEEANKNIEYDIDIEEDEAASENVTEPTIRIKF